MNQRIYYFYVIYSKWNIPIRYYLFQSHFQLGRCCYLEFLSLIPLISREESEGDQSDVISWDQTLQINGDFFQIKLEREVKF